MPKVWQAYYGDGSDLNEWDKWLNGYNEKKEPPQKTKKSHRINQKKYDLKEMMDKVNDENFHEEVETRLSGKDEW